MNIVCYQVAAVKRMPGSNNNQLSLADRDYLDMLGIGYGQGRSADDKASVCHTFCLILNSSANILIVVADLH